MPEKHHRINFLCQLSQTINTSSFRKVWVQGLKKWNQQLLIFKYFLDLAKKLILNMTSSEHYRKGLSRSKYKQNGLLLNRNYTSKQGDTMHIK